jgi:hypothetical protein
MKIYLANFPTPDQHETLTKAGIKNRLLSFYHLKDKRPDIIRDIVETGLTDYIDRPDEPIDEVPLDVHIICGRCLNAN